MSAARKPLEEYLALEYPFTVIADPDGGYVVKFPDLLGCLTQFDQLEDLPAMVEDARRLWIETEYEAGHDIPLPSYPEEYSGKFNLRVPRSLHRSLAEAAEGQGVSLNQYVVALLSRRGTQARLDRRLEAIEERLAAIDERLRLRAVG
jgi:antitoxin HicB